MKSVVITGVSTGIGYAAVKELVERGYFVFGSVRKQIDADRLSAEFGGERFAPLLFDVTDQAAIRTAAEQVTQRIGPRGLAGLVNNAGVAVPGPILHTSVDEFRRQFEVNLFGVIAVTQAFLPLLGAQRGYPHAPGRVINISSVAGRIAMPFLSPYAASKHALEAFTDSLRREMIRYGIDVLSIQPGPIKTAIWDKYDDDIAEQYADTDFYESAQRFATIARASAKTGQPVEVVAHAIRQALESPHPKPRIALPESWLAWWLAQLLPVRMVDWLVARRVGLKRVEK